MNEHLTDSVWRKSSYSNGQDNCVEVRQTQTGQDVRDSKDKSGPILRFSADEWRAFIDGARAGEFG